MSLWLNLGCGDNKLPAPWQNHDSDVDITEPLPWLDNSARFIVIEHCVEHINYYQAIEFFKEALRVLEIGGTLRVTVPSLTQVMNCQNQEYFDWLKEKGWAPTADDRGAMHAMLYCHGHKTAWNAMLMEATLYFAGFNAPRKQETLGWSSHPHLCGVEGHAKVIGEKFNTIESITFEAAKMTGDLSKDYDDKFYAMHVGWRGEYNVIAHELIEHLPEFKSVVDFGCGNGFIIEALRKRGKDVLGIDGSESAQKANPNVLVLDITKPCGDIHMDLVICTEVAEHVPADKADALVDNLCAAARDVIFFSAAQAGHGGHLHLNEQPRRYWIEKFVARGFDVDNTLTDTITAILRNKNKRTWWFADNCFVLRKRTMDVVKSVTVDHEVMWSTKRKIAVVIGGGERVWDDIETAREFCTLHRLEPVWFATNDMIAKFPEPIVAVTLHPDKLGKWIGERRNAGWSMPVQTWSHDGGSRATNPYVTHRLTDWGGSVGLFGYVVARHRGHDHDRVLLCGVPMTSDNHFIRKLKWFAVAAFARAWEAHKTEMLPYVRSLSGGWTKELFGEPDADWLNTEKEAAA